MLLKSNFKTRTNENSQHFSATFTVNKLGTDVNIVSKLRPVAFHPRHVLILHIYMYNIIYKLLILIAFEPNQ